MWSKSSAFIRRYCTGEVYSRPNENDCPVANHKPGVGINFSCCRPPPLILMDSMVILGPFLPYVLDKLTILEPGLLIKQLDWYGKTKCYYKPACLSKYAIAKHYPIQKSPNFIGSVKHGATDKCFAGKSIEGLVLVIPPTFPSKELKRTLFYLWSCSAPTSRILLSSGRTCLAFFR